MAEPYSDVDTLRVYLRAGPSEEGETEPEDALLTLAIEAASRAIDRSTNTTFEADEIPSGIQLACLIQASRLVKRRDAPFGVAGSPEFGSELRLLAKLDPDVEALCIDYRVWWAIL